MAETNRRWTLEVAALLALGCGATAVAAQSRPSLAPAARQPSASTAAVAAPSHAPAGDLLGLVTDAAGRPQANAVVEVRSGGLHHPVVHLLTSAAGVFSLTGMEPGTYYVEVGKGARVAARRQVEVHASERALLLVNLPQLLQSVQFGPPAGSKSDPAFDWALRQATIWRPILRLDGSNSPDFADDPTSDPVQGYVALTAGAGSSAFSGPDLATAFRVDTTFWGGSRLSLTGDVGTDGQGDGSDTRVQASFRRADASSQQRLTMAVRQISVPGLPALPSLRVMSLNYADGMNLSDHLRLQYGAMVNAVSMTDTVSTFDPYLRAIYRVGDQSQLEYRVASAVPPIHFNRDYADMPDPTPQVTLDNNRARLERARHQELLYTDSVTPNDSLTAALFDESFHGAAVNGAEADSQQLGAGNLLPDMLNNMFIANGGDYGGWGYRVVYERRLSENWRADLGYSDGAVLAPQADKFSGDLAAALAAARAHAFTVKLSGVTPLSHTRLICSYRALSQPTVTGLDLYDDGPGQSDSYANVYLRQPLPGLMGGGNGKIEALVEIHNLLAQGYVPMMGSDGHTLYLVQSARSLRGGFTISF